MSIKLTFGTEEEKKEDVAFDKENVDFIKVPLDPTYGENLKKCKCIHEVKYLPIWIYDTYLL